ncbi:MAG: hypothetical protein HY762_09735 [Planctomycetes bacterium]|nr:hypothetical protein [Planctomycetota bacterium]
MNHSLKTGFSFGSTSGVITTLGLMVGLHSGTHSKMAVLGGILTIAIADAFSDALGIHIAEESENTHTPREIWVATVSTFIAKFIVALTFTIPVLLWELQTAIMAGVAWGLLLITVISIRMAHHQKIKASRVVLEHLIIVIVVIVITHYVGDWVATFS